jgi:histidine triad (HIT) family protein
MIVRTNKMNNCLLCALIKNKYNKILYEDRNFIVTENKIKITKLHLMVISKKHISQREFFKYSYLFGKLNKIINELSPMGWRVIINYGCHAGQVEDHCHFHILGGEQLQNIGGI